MKEQKEQIVKLDRLAKKGLRVSVRIPDIQTWQKIIKVYPTIPWSFP